MIKARIAALGALVFVTACEGLKEAMTAHVDVVARAEKQELSVQRLADLMGNSQIPLAKPVAEQVADFWVSYQLLGKAASVSDSMVDTVLIDKVMKPVHDRSKLTKWMQVVQAGYKVDTSTATMEAVYNEGKRLLSAKHILFQVPQGQEATGSDSVMRRAESVRRQINDRNFAALAKQHGSDGTKDQGGELGVFPPEQMVAEFSAGVAALKPGEIGMVRTGFGYHIVRRNTFAEVHQQFAQLYAQSMMQTADSTYVADLEKAKNVEAKPNAPKVMKEVAADVYAHMNDRTVLSSSTGETHTAGEFAHLLNSNPQRQMREEIQKAADTLLTGFAKQLVIQELLLKQADSAGIKPDTAEVSAIRNAFKGLVRNAWAGLRISPELLADSAKTPAEKERLAASRIEAYLDRLLQAQENLVDIPPPLAELLREKYDGSIKQAGLTRAIEMAQKTRSAADSSRAAAQPKSAVPMPPDTSRGGSSKR